MKVKNIFFCTILLALFLSSLPIGHAQAQPAKDEVIYALLEDKGAIDHVYVVNSFELKERAMVTDYGAYTEVKNLTNLTPLDKQKEKVSFEAEQGKFHYQGSLPTDDLPWDIDITYFLDDQEVSAEALSSANGDISIALDINENENVPGVFFEHFILQITLSFPMEDVYDVKAEEGIIANAGENKQVTFTVMPGDGGTFTTSLQSDAFSMDGIEFAGVPASFDFDMPDMTDFEKNMRQLTKAIRSIHDGTSNVTNGLTSLHEGANSLTEGSSEFQAGLNKATEEMVQATTEMNSSFEEVDGIIDALRAIDFDAFETYMSEMDAFANNMDEIIEALEVLKANVKETNEAMKAWIDALPSTSIDQADIDALYESDADPAVIDELLSAYEASIQVREEMEAFASESTIPTDAIDQVIGQLQEASEGMEELSEMAVILQEGSSIKETITELNDMFTAFKTGITDLQTGMQDLSSHYTSIHEGIVELGSGIAEIEDGAKALQNGTGELAEETKNLPTAMSDEMDALMDAYDFSDFEMVSFVSQKNTSIRSVQFIMKTNKIDLLPEEKPNEQEKEEKSFWQKFIDLFRKG